MIVFLCGARDYHAMDWYRSAKLLLKDQKIVLLTDLIGGEGYEKLINESDIVNRLLILDNLLVSSQTSFGNKWRNLLKLIVTPLQVLLIKRFARKNPNAIFFAHSMYYLYLAAKAKVNYIGTPQGSEILVRLDKSSLYQKMARKALMGAKAITVDSIAMKKKIAEFCGIDAHVIQNGIDLSAINNSIALQKSIDTPKNNNYLSVRAITPLYRIDSILTARNAHFETNPIGFNLIYPFFEQKYRTETFRLLKEGDIDYNRVSREKMYELMQNSKIVFSIPISDSSPRSVYESIFCGCIVIITYNKYLEILPNCMKERIVVVDLNDSNWFLKAIDIANEKLAEKFNPDEYSIELFDQVKSFEKVSQLLFN